MIEIRDIVKTADGIEAFCKDIAEDDWIFVRLDKDLDVVEPVKYSFTAASAAYKLREIFKFDEPVPETASVYWG